jgi:hypothetical protein
LLLFEAVALHYCLFDPGGAEESTGLISCLRVLIWASTFARHFHGLQRCKPGIDRKDAGEITKVRQVGSNDITRFLQDVDPLLHYRQLVDWNIGRASEFLTISNRFVVLYTVAPPPFALSVNNPLVNKSSINRPMNFDREVPIVIDTGASWSVTPCIQDFVSEITSSFEKLQSLDGSIDVSGSGIIEWQIQDQDGILKIIRHRALYVPTAGVRLFSPQTYFKEHNGGSLECQQKGLILTLHDGSRLTFPWQPPSGNRPPTFH